MEPKVHKRILRFGTSLYAKGREPLWAIVSQVLTSGGNFATTIIIVRALGLAEFGRFSIALMLTLIVRNIHTAAILTPMMAVYPKLHGRGVARYRAFLLANGIIFALATSGAIYLGAIVVSHLIGAPWLGTIAAPMALANFATIIGDFVQRKLFVAGRVVAGAMIDGLRMGLQVAGLAALAVFAGDLLTVSAALWLVFLSATVGVLFGMAYFGRFEWAGSYSRAVWPRHWFMMRWLTPGMAFNSLLDPGLVFFAGFVLGDAAVGALRAMQNIGNILMIPLNAMQRVAATEVARRAHSGGLAALNAYKRQLYVLLPGVAAILTLAVYVLRRPLIELTVGAYRSELAVLLVLFALSNACGAFRAVFNVLLQGIERPRPITVNSAFCAAGAIVGLFLLAPRFGEASVPAIRIFVYAAGGAFLGLSFRRACASMDFRTRSGLRTGRAEPDGVSDPKAVP